MAEESSNIDPVFLDFSKDIKRSSIGDVELIYKQNTENERFKLDYIFEMGTDNDNRLKLAIDYFKFLGTNEMNSLAKQEEFYKLGCDLSVNCTADKTQVTLSGLSNNFNASVALLKIF